MPVKIGAPADFQSGEHLLRIAPFTVVGSQHIGRNRFSESPGTAVADISLKRSEYLIGVFQKASFIYVNFRIQCNFKCRMIRIDKHSHRIPLCFPHLLSVQCQQQFNISTRSSGSLLMLRCTRPEAAEYYPAPSPAADTCRSMPPFRASYPG